MRARTTLPRAARDADGARRTIGHALTRSPAASALSRGERAGACHRTEGASCACSSAPFLLSAYSNSGNTFFMSMGSPVSFWRARNVAKSFFMTGTDSGRAARSAFSRGSAFRL